MPEILTFVEILTFEAGLFAVLLAVVFRVRPEALPAVMQSFADIMRSVANLARSIARAARK
jgi:hypothetical protein